MELRVNLKATLTYKILIFGRYNCLTMKKLLLLTFICATAFAFKPTENRVNLDFDLNKIWELLHNNGNKSKTYDPEKTAILKRTWLAPVLYDDDDDKVILYSNQTEAIKANCNINHFIFYEESLVKITPMAINCKDSDRYQDKSKVYSVLYDDGIFEDMTLLYTTYRDKSTTEKINYKVVKLEKVEYDSGEEGYEITMNIISRD